MRRTRRRQRQLWLPVYGQGGNETEGVTQGNAFGGTVQLTITGNPEIAWDAAPVTFDTQLQPEDVQNTLGITPTLRDVVAGSEWSLRRVVGKCFVTVAAGAGNIFTATRAPAVEAAAGLIVCNTDEGGFPSTNFDNVNPLSQDGAEDPWVWQRQWLLGTGGPPGAFYNYTTGILDAPSAGIQLPISNISYGSVADGPHVDQKTSRRIHRQQRLFMVVAARPVRFNDLTVSTTDITIDFRWHLRYLGNIRAARGNRGNAAR